ncbi:hypothetical protein FisN_23Lh095 [Fistulifera solaris]|uniref:GH16 domain-containing protein n=1 Tax=Fistulifera solaris TaxID=1519565 RepID=A0A1Z5KLX5_FISSO|nr:hypothetical protein FisN_23Lh095 [Fistulifera solaris]|eukprot:GAX27330.1 hypothetical protein FisN_23Lh095 [Fistulifera solaris]
MVTLAIIRISSGSFIDIETPLDKRTTTSLIDGTTYHLVMSDEFNVENRTFKDGHDPLWTALDKSDDDASSAGGGSMQFYNSSAVTTKNGFLRIATYLERTEWNRYDHIKKEWKHEIKNFTSGMVQSWEKFCFTGGIVEVDVIFPGEAYIGGLWPAIWMLGNLGRATYEPSTNNLWPWSYNKCDRELQQAQTISACNAQNHYGMHPKQGRGATEIDIVEVMTGSSDGPIPGTKPGVSYPYCDMTLQVAPGVTKNRPQSGALPKRKNVLSKNGHTEFLADTWYDGLMYAGNTSINPFFYGTYMAETKPNEPVSRTKKQAFQADAVGVVHELTPAHFEKPHTFRLEWQPGRGGRLDWFVKSHKIENENGTIYVEGDGKGEEWVHAFGIEDKSLEELTGSQIPIEPSYFIMNVAVSSTWGFPYDRPEWCPKDCFDCANPQCACSFYPGYCQMLESGKTAMYIDHIRLYQSSDDAAHVGQPHTLGCDPPEYPTKEWIEGHYYHYMRNPPFSFEDTRPLRKVPRGGGTCTSDADCGGNVVRKNFTAAFEKSLSSDLSTKAGRRLESVMEVHGGGKCSSEVAHGGLFGLESFMGSVCVCEEGFTGPHCMSQDMKDTFPSAYELNAPLSPFRAIPNIALPGFMFAILSIMSFFLMLYLNWKVNWEKKPLESKHLINSSRRKDEPSKPGISLVTGNNI